MTEKIISEILVSNERLIGRWEVSRMYTRFVREIPQFSSALLLNPETGEAVSDLADCDTVVCRGRQWAVGRKWEPFEVLSAGVVWEFAPDGTMTEYTRSRKTPGTYGLDVQTGDLSLCRQAPGSDGFAEDSFTEVFHLEAGGPDTLYAYGLENCEWEYANTPYRFDLIRVVSGAEEIRP